MPFGGYFEELADKTEMPHDRSPASPLTLRIPSSPLTPRAPSSPSTPRVRNRRRSTESQALADTSRTNGSQLLVNDRDKYHSMLIRAYSSLWMIAAASVVVYLGHLYIWAMVVIIQIFMVQELFNLCRQAHEDKRLPGFRLLNWHFFVTAMLFVYGRILNRQLVNTVSSDKVSYKLLSGIIKYQMVICYFLYIAGLIAISVLLGGSQASDRLFISDHFGFQVKNLDLRYLCLIQSGFVWFILTLKKKMYKYQFSQYAWTHMILIVVFIQSSFTAANIFEGIFWFLLPAALIVVNDVAAYIFGFFFGKTPLIKLSPKKTWEGFIGASVTTLIAAFVLGNLMGRSQWMTCPRKDLSIGWLRCDPGPLFKPEYYPLPQWISQLFHVQEIAILPVQWHALCLGLFASIIAPFGGFFASGFKRALKIKDFGDSIPGHGGFTDRMDCQMVMAVFAYIYHQSFVALEDLSVDRVLDQILSNLSYEEQESLYMQLGQIFHERQVTLQP